MILGRFLVGIQAGCSLCLLPLFIIEASPNDSRPFLSSLQVRLLQLYEDKAQSF